MSQITHLQSATQLIDLSGVRILTDPWLTGGEYMGTWFHHPQFPGDKISALKYDYIYVSHIHPDHLSHRTFDLLPYKVPVLIPKFQSQFLSRKISGLGWDVVELDHASTMTLGNNVSVTIFLADNCNPELCGRFFGCKVDNSAIMSPNIDSIALFQDSTTRILNTNDAPFDLAFETIKAHSLERDVDVLLVGYAGAGPWPHCFDLTDERKFIEAEKKKRKFLDYAVRFVELVKPRFYIPFAGTYILGGDKSVLNKYRGVPTIAESIAYIDSKKSVSEPVGVAMNQFDVFDLGTGEVQNAESTASLEETLQSIGAHKVEFSNAYPSADLFSLCDKAYARFKKVGAQISLTSQTFIVIKTSLTTVVFSNDSPPIVNGDWRPDESDQVLQIELEHELFLALLNGPRYAHWNNAEIGSHLRFKRVNVEFERDLGHALYYFHA